MRRHLILLMIISMLVGVLSGCASPEPLTCDVTQVTAARDDLQTLTERFAEVGQQANVTPADSIGPIIASLETIQNETADLSVPDCAVAARDAQVALMGLAIDEQNLRVNNGLPEDFDDLDLQIDAAFLIWQAELANLDALLSELSG